MAKNDTILLDGIIEERIEKSLPSDQKNKVFEYFTFEQVLKNKDLSRDEIEAGMVDGSLDGGIDGFYVFINGHMLVDDKMFVWPKSSVVIELYIITCKHKETFQQAPLDNLLSSVIELLDFQLDKNDFSGKYSDKIIECRERLCCAYRKVSYRLSKLYVNYVYASRGDTSKLGDSVDARSNQIVSETNRMFSNCDINFNFLGSAELVDLNRKMRDFTLELPLVDFLHLGDSYLLLASLSDYANFIMDGKDLRRYLFDSNVRDFMGLNRVNEDIRNTLLDDMSPDFWWLNNGVTVLVSQACVIGKKLIELKDIQIVNGLQTSESIYRHFVCGGVDDPERSILVKVIVATDADVRDAVIRSTNNQTNVELASLHATDKIQRDIEDIMIRYGVFYERRTNFYFNKGHLQEEIVTPLYLAAAYVSIGLKSPIRASKLKSKFMRSDKSYGVVFNDGVPLEMWPRLAVLYKKIDKFLQSQRARRVGMNSGEGFLKKWRYLLGFNLISNILGTYGYAREGFVSLNIQDIDDDLMGVVFDFLWNANDELFTNPRAYKRPKMVKELCRLCSIEFDIDGYDEWARKKQVSWNSKESYRGCKVDLEFAMKVDELLPSQPWKPGVHLDVMKKLECTYSQYYGATSLLIQKGIRSVQKDGVVYDPDGKVLKIDEERVDAQTLKLFDV